MPGQVLCIYALPDQLHFQLLRRHLEGRPDLTIRDWHGAPAGTSLAAARAHLLAHASVVVLLLSVDFLSEPGCRAAAAEVAHRGPIPVLLRAATLPPELACLALLPGDGVPLVEQQKDRDALFLDIAQAVFAAVDARPAAPPRPGAAAADLDDHRGAAAAERDQDGGLASSSPSAAGALTDLPTAKNELTQLLTQRFRQSERQNLLHRLGLDPEEVKLRPEDREEFARAMVVHLDNRGRLAELWDQVARERPALLHGRANPFR